MQVTVDTTTTGRFEIKGPLSSQTKSIWFVFHGYAMRADSFIDSFDCIQDEQTVIVAPEGLHRFYSKGTRGNVAANWMTKDLRENDIENNISFLNEVYANVVSSELGEDVKIGILAFSQGGPTAVRWAAQLDRSIDEIVVWGSDLPNDVVTNPHKLKKVNSSNLKFIVGSKDEYISSERVDDLIMEMHDHGVEFDFHTFEGKHELHEESIRYFHARLIDNKLEY